MPDIVFHFHRNVLSDLPAKLDACAARQTDAKLRAKLTACAKVFRGWLTAPEAKIRCDRSEESWRWLVDAARESGAHTFREVLRLRLVQLDIQRENEAERKGLEDRTKAGMAEYVQRGSL